MAVHLHGPSSRGVSARHPEVSHSLCSVHIFLAKPTTSQWIISDTQGEPSEGVFARHSLCTYFLAKPTTPLFQMLYHPRESRMADEQKSSFPNDVEPCRLIGANCLRNKQWVAATPRCTLQGHFSYMIVTGEHGFFSPLRRFFVYFRQQLKDWTLQLTPHVQCAWELAMYLGLPPLWTMLRGNTVAGHRLLVKAGTKRGDSLTVARCQSRCSLRHLSWQAGGGIQFPWKWVSR